MNSAIKTFIFSLLLALTIDSLYSKDIAIIGTGYVGLVSGAGLAEFGNTVVCADIDQNKIERLNKGEIPIYEPGLDDLVAKQITAHRLAFTSDVAGAIRGAEVVIIAVGTPMSDSGAADLRAVHAVINTISQNLTSYKIICTKSTVPIGTGEHIKKILLDRGISESLFDVVSNPELLREGKAVNDFLSPDYFIIGAETPKAYAAMREVYQYLLDKDTPIIETNLSTAEIIKYASNGLLAIKVSYINEIANLCDATGADVRIVSNAIGKDKRIGPYFLNPGPGFGGSCFPKDSQALAYQGNVHNVSMNTVLASLITNEMQKNKPTEKLFALLNKDAPDGYPTLNDKTIAILGLAFKGDTDDIRYSPALRTIDVLLNHGAHITAYDPAAMENTKKQYPTITYCSTSYEAISGAHAVIILTEWEEFKHLDIAKMGSLMNQKIIVDARNLLNTDELKANGFIYETIGTPKD